MTGGTGVIGRAAVTALVDAGHDVVVVTRSAAGADAVAAMGAGPVRGDVLDVDGLARAYEGADAVINLATNVPVGHRALVPGAWRRHDRLRTTGVTNVVEAARRAGVRRVVQESVSFMYADQGDEWITETQPGRDHLDDRARRGGGVPRAGLRLRLAGRRRAPVRHDRRRRRRRRATGSAPPATAARIGIGHPSDWAHVIHTDDLGGAVLASLHAPSGVYNVGAEPVQRLDLVQGYADAAGVESARLHRHVRSLADRPAPRAAVPLAAGVQRPLRRPDRLACDPAQVRRRLARRDPRRTRGIGPQLSR